MAFPTTPILDDFNRPDEGPPITGWVDILNGLKIDTIECAADAMYSASYFDTSYDADCEVYFTVTADQSDLARMGLFARIDLVGGNAYYAYWIKDITDGDTLNIARLDGFVTVNLASYYRNVQVGDKIGLRCEGSTFTLWYKPVAGVWTDILTVSDSTYSNDGYLGVSLVDTICRCDDFGGGDYTAPPIPAGSSSSGLTYFDPNNQAQYSVWLKNPQGELLQIVDNFLFLEMVRVANDVGSLKLIVEKSNLPAAFLQPDSIIEVWRKLTGTKRAYLEGETQFRVRKIREISSQNGIDLEIIAMDTMELMNRSVVAYPAGSTHTKKSDVAGTIIYEFVYENMDIVGAADADRWEAGGYPAAYFRLAPDMGFGAAVNSRDAIGKSILVVCQDAAKQSKELGTYIYFDIVVVAGNQLEFRVYDGQRGINHGAGSGQEIVLSEAAGTLENSEKTVDYSGQISVSFALGSGQENNRLIGVADDALLLALSPFGRIEKCYDARQTTIQASLNNIAKEALSKYQQKTIINGNLADSGLRYGIDYGFGDRLQIGFQSETYTARINGIKITLNEGREEIRAALEVEQ